MRTYSECGLQPELPELGWPHLQGMHDDIYSQLALCREHSADFTVSLYLMQTLCDWNNIPSYLCFWSCIVFLQEKHRLYENKSSM